MCSAEEKTCGADASHLRGAAFQSRSLPGQTETDCSLRVNKTGEAPVSGYQFTRSS